MTTALAAARASAAVGATQAVGWGGNSLGELGDGTAVDRATPSPVQEPTGVAFTQVAAGFRHSVALAADGTAWSWGANAQGQLGSGSKRGRRVPGQVQMPIGVTFVSVSAGGYQSEGLATDGSAWAWGSNAYGQLGDGTKVERRQPVKVGLPAGVTLVSLSAGAYHTLALGSDGSAWAWGGNSYGQLGDGSIGDRPVPAKVSAPAGVTFTSVSAGVYHSVAIASDGSIWAWGSNFYGELGDGTVQKRLKPVKLIANATFTRVSAGYYFTVALTATGKARAWGRNSHGQLGDGTTVRRKTPVKVLMPARVRLVDVSAGLDHAMGLAENGSVWAWGRNQFGQLGDGTTVSRSRPAKVALPSSWKASQIVAAGAHSLAMVVPQAGRSGPGAIGRGAAHTGASPRSAPSSANPGDLGSSGTVARRRGQEATTVDWPELGFDQANSGNNPNETVVGVGSVDQLTSKWVANVSGYVYSGPAIVNGVVYVGDDAGYLYALDAETGSQLWATPTGGTIVESAPAVSGGVVYVGSSDTTGGLFAIDATTGTTLWTAPTNGAVNSSPTVGQGAVYVGSQDGSLYAYDPASGAVLWAAPTGKPIVTSSPALADGVVYVGSGVAGMNGDQFAGPGTMNAYDAATGAPLWVGMSGSRITASPTVVNGVVYVGAEDGRAWAFDAGTGAALWSTPVGMFGFSTAVANGVVFIGSNPGQGSSNMYALDAVTGAVLWGRTVSGTSSVYGNPAVANGVVYVQGFTPSDVGFRVYAVDAATGETLWSAPAGPHVASAPVIVNGVVYVGSDYHLTAYSLPAAARASAPPA